MGVVVTVHDADFEHQVKLTPNSLAIVVVLHDQFRTFSASMDFNQMKYLTEAVFPTRTLR